MLTRKTFQVSSFKLFGHSTQTSLKLILKLLSSVAQLGQFKMSPLSARSESLHGRSLMEPLQSSIARVFVVACLVLLFGSAAAFAQTSTGTIEGTATDPQGSILLGANVTARQVTTNLVRSVTTNN
jgi:hypothetical protein